MQGLIQQMGGIEATERRLDLMFVPKLRTVDLGVGVASGTTLFNPGRHAPHSISSRGQSLLHDLPRQRT